MPRHIVYLVQHVQSGAFYHFTRGSADLFTHRALSAKQFTYDDAVAKAEHFNQTTPGATYTVSNYMEVC